MVSPTAKDYGDQNVGTSGAATPFTLTTSSNRCTLSIFGTCETGTQTNFQTSTSDLGGGMGGTVTSGDFRIHNVDCPYPSFPSPPVAIAPIGFPATCHFEVSFSPTAGGTRTKTLSFPDTDGSTAAVSLSGNGLGGPVTTPTPTPTPTTTLPPPKKCKKKHRKAASAKKCKKKR